MILPRRDVVPSHEPYLVTRDSRSNTQTSVVSNKVPKSTLIVAIVLGVVGLLLFVVIAIFVYRGWKRRRKRSGSLASVSVKKESKDAVHMHVDLENASVADENDEELELEKPKSVALAGISDDNSAWHTSLDGKSEDMDAEDRDAGWVSQIKTSRYETSILEPESSYQRSAQPKFPQGPRPMNDTPPTQERRPTHHTMPSLTNSEILGVSPPPSYSFANSLGGVLSRVADVEVLEESRSGTGSDLGSASASPSALKSARSHVPSPFPLASSSRNRLDSTSAGGLLVQTPTRSESRMSMATAAANSLSTSSIHHLKNGSQTSFGRITPTQDRNELPRLMSVVSTYVPNMEDELPIKVGDTVRMLEEFKDGWCMVQYPGKFDAVRGVVPRICLRERKSIVPVRKSSISSLSSSSSFRR